MHILYILFKVIVGFFSKYCSLIGLSKKFQINIYVYMYIQAQKLSNFLQLYAQTFKPKKIFPQA